jgi:hypothetical protein
MKKVHIKKIKNVSKVSAKQTGVACTPSGDPTVSFRKG